MTLYRRIFWGMVVISSFLLGLTFLSTRFILADGYRQLEETNAKQNLERVINVLQDAVDSIPMDDIVRVEQPPLPLPYIPQNSAQSFTNDNLVSRMSLGARLNIALLLDHENNIIFHKAIDTKTNDDHSLPQAILDSIKPGSPLLAGNNSLAIVKGIISTSQGLMMMISAPVYPHTDGGTSWGRFIAGRYIDADEIQHIENRTKLDVEMAAFDDEQTPNDFQAAKLKLGEGQDFYIDSGNGSVISSYTVMRDIYGKPALLLRAQTPRLIYQQGLQNINTFFASLMLIVILLAGVVFLFLERTVLSRLIALNAGLAQVKLSSNNFTLEVPTSGQDEITNLTSSIKQVLKGYSQTYLQLQDTQNNLEKRVLDRTSELSNANSRLEQEIADYKQAHQVITQTRDKAISDLQLKSQLLANVSHDARTPLTIINLNTEMLQQGRHGVLNSRQNEVLDRILNANRQLLNFITNMLDEAQLKHGKMSFVNVLFEPKLLIEDFVSMLEPLAESKGIKLKAEIDLALPSQLRGDPERFKQILSNLTENAIKFTDAGTVTIKAIRTDSQHWMIQVVDTGPGIAPEVQTRIFEAYWQLNSTLKSDSGRGVGLGLSIVKQIVQLMNGTITVESKVGEGTTFTVTLPIVRDQEKASSELVGQINN